MKSTFYKIIALILACLMLIPFSGCTNDSGKDDPEVTGDISGNIGYTPALSAFVRDAINNSEIVKAQKDSKIDVFTGFAFPEKEEGVRVSDEAYARSLEIKDHLNVQIVSTDGGSFTENAD